ncbi:MAG: hypothetical protein WC341_09190 [Bacteroidales bacterium]|jgi:hypothetical protein
MKKEIFDLKLLFLLLILFSCPNLKSQTISNQDSLIRIQKVTSLLINNPAPQYIVEIKNDMTISFYNILPENFSKPHAGFEGWFIDSTTINIESSDFLELKKTIKSLDLNNINSPQKRKSEHEIDIFVSGYSPDNYIIETSSQITRFSIGVYDKDISVSKKEIRNIFEKIVDKYKPKQ